MTTETDLPPLPSGNVAHLIAAQAAEIEALRAEVERERDELRRLVQHAVPYMRWAAVEDEHDVAPQAWLHRAEPYREGK